MTNIPASIFKTYDIRGKNLIDEQAYIIGKGIGTYLNRQYEQKRVVVGYDARQNSEALFQGLSAGLFDVGLTVVNIGLVATPVVYMQAALNRAAGIMITASHLGRDYNGFKIVVGNKVIFNDELEVIYQHIRDADFDEGEGRIIDIQSANTSYEARLLDSFKRSGRRLRIVVDSGNGMAGPYIGYLLRNMGYEVIELNEKPDGTFPVHPADPSKEQNMHQLKLSVRQNHAHLGLAFDGDADRVGVVDENGDFVSADRILAWLAKDILSKLEQSFVVADVSSSQVVAETVLQANGHFHRSPTGHAFVREATENYGAAIGGEVSGHMFFNDRYLGYDDGIYAGCRIAEALSLASRTLSEELADLPSLYSTPVLRPYCPNDLKQPVLDYLQEQLSDYPIEEAGGLLVEFPNGWAVLRASNTEEKLSFRFEARTEEDLIEYQGMLQSLVSQEFPDVEPFIK